MRIIGRGIAQWLDTLAADWLCRRGYVITRHRDPAPTDPLGPPAFKAEAAEAVREGDPVYMLGDGRVRPARRPDREAITLREVEAAPADCPPGLELTAEYALPGGDTFILMRTGAGRLWQAWRRSPGRPDVLALYIGPSGIDAQTAVEVAADQLASEPAIG